MSFASPISERKLKNTARVVHQSMWLLFLIAAGLMLAVRRSVPARTGSIWILGCAVVAFMLSFALRDVVRKVGHRNTEDKIVKEVRTYLENEPAIPVVHPAPPPIPYNGTARPAGDAFVPSTAADFVPLKGATNYHIPDGEPVVYDAFPVQESVIVKTDFYAVLLPVMQTC